MTLYFRTEGKVKVRMYNYVDGMLAELLPEMGGTAVTPAAANHLFTVKKDAERLDKATSAMFHHHTAKLLYLSKQARPGV
jgi:hypothetical protein